MKWTGSTVTCYILTKSLAIWGRGAELWEAVGARAGTPDPERTSQWQVPALSFASSVALGLSLPAVL